MVLAHMRRLRATLLVFITVAASVPSHAASARDVMVFAAATLQDALDEATTRFQAEAHIGVPVSYGPSAALVKQIANGAPADIFISADADWMNEAEHEGLLYPAIVYPVALTVAGGANPDAARFLAFLKSPAAKSIFASHGYSFLP
jgi:ABC-type molybdate transport system substrate-binding protein